MEWHNDINHVAKMINGKMRKHPKNEPHKNCFSISYLPNVGYLVTEKEREVNGWEVEQRTLFRLVNIIKKTHKIQCTLEISIHTRQINVHNIQACCNAKLNFLKKTNHILACTQYIDNETFINTLCVYKSFDRGAGYKNLNKTKANWLCFIDERRIRIVDWMTLFSTTDGMERRKEMNDGFYVEIDLSLYLWCDRNKGVWEQHTLVQHDMHEIANGKGAEKRLNWKDRIESTVIIEKQSGEKKALNCTPMHTLKTNWEHVYGKHFTQHHQQK